jgi:hypothetical protein
MPSNYERVQGSWSKKGSKEDSPKVLLSFEFLDITQGQSLKQWSNDNDLLLKLTEMYAALNKLTLRQALIEKYIIEYDIDDNKKFASNNMPLDSAWKYPKILPNKRVKWCKIRLGSTRRIIGYLESNVFYAVFLDKDHEFYPTEPNNT